MRITVATLAGAVLVALPCLSAVQAQGVPPGSYQRSCTDAHIEGNALVATCRTRGGGAQRSALAAVNRCAGDIGNNDGVLQCSSRSGQLRGTVPSGPEYGGPPPQPGYYGGPPPEPGYGRPGYGPREGYGERRYGEEARERCIGLHREAERLRGRIAETYDPYERGRIEGRLREVRERQEEYYCR